jgi:serine/threonine-protein kinase
MQSDTLVANPTLGRLLKGQYRIDDELGRGAMGVVFRGTHVALGKTVAIKMLTGAGFGSKDAFERFEREARTASILNHPSIAQVFDYGLDDNVPFLVMEFVDGKELASVIESEGPLPPARAIEIMKQLAAALEEAHRHGVVHRDIKPQNMKLVRYTPGGPIFLKVLDFGIAKQVGAEAGKLTATGAVLGTPIYMAPEQAGGATSKIDGRADQYAAGIVLYEMLTGQVPFNSDTLAGVLVSHLTMPPPPLPRTVPEPLRALVMRLLAKQPEDRFPDAGALYRALVACEPACRDAKALTAGSVQPITAPGVGKTGEQRRFPLYAGAAALGVALAVLGGALYYGPRLHGQDPGPKGKDPAPIAAVQDPRPTPGTEPVARKPDPPPDPTPGPAGRKPDPPPTPTPGPVARKPDLPPDPTPGPRAHVAESKEVKDKLDEAEAFFKKEEYDQALRSVAQALGLQKVPRAYKIQVRAYCMQGIGSIAPAREALNRLSGADRKQAVEFCRRHDIEF